MGKRKYCLFGCVLCLAFLVSCAAGPNLLDNVANKAGEIAGFWMGLWHGIIAPITWIISLFTDSINFYEVHNNGGWYDFGFILGIGALCGGSSSSRK